MKSTRMIGNGYDMSSVILRVKSRISSIKYALTVGLMLMVGVSNAWGNSVSSANSSSDISNGKIVMNGNHATFTFAAAGTTITRGLTAYQLGSIDHGGTKTCTFTWSANSGCSIKVTKIEFGVRGYTTNIGRTGEMQATFNGETKSIGSILTTLTTFSATNNSGFSSGIALTLKNTCGGHGWLSKSYDSFDYYLNDISITYTITPNAPGVNPTTASVNVTLDANSPTNLNVANYFSSTDHFNSKTYTVSSNPESAGAISDNNFYATDSGTYVVKAKYNASTNCHEASGWSNGLTITVNPRLQSFDVTDGGVDISMAGDVVSLDMRTLISNYSGYNTADPSFEILSASNGGDVTKASKKNNYYFSATQLGTYRVKVTYAGTKQYRELSKEFDVTVGLRTPTIVFAEPEHIYSGNALDNMAKVQYKGVDVPLSQVDFDYSLDNPSWFLINPENEKQILVSTNYNEATKATLHVTTVGTNYYESVSASHEYDLEVKKTPEFYLNGTLLDKTKTTDLYLEIDSTATFTFDKITSDFQYPDNTKTTHFTYNNETGVLTATVAGDEQFFFNEPGDAVTFQHKCDLHLYVSKHTTELTTTLKDNDVWMVDDSIAENTLYTLVKGDANVPVVISSDKPSVIAKENGKWVAKGKGSAVLTIAQVNSNKWTGDTITRTINVNRYDPVFDWSGLPDTLNFNTTFVNPVRSTSDGAITYKSNKAAVTVTNDSTTLHTAETANSAVTITAMQKPTYKYEGKTETKTVKVLKLRNHVQVEVNSNETYLAVRNKTEGDVAYTSNGIRLGGSSTGTFSSPAWNWADKYIDVAFEGVPDKISFTTGITQWSATANVVSPGSGNNNGFWYMIEYPTGESAHTLWTENDNSNPGYIEYNLKPNTNKVRICYTGNFAGYVTNLTITERTELSIDGNVESLDFGSTDAGSNATKKNFTFDWYNLNPLTLSIEGGDGKYSVSPSSIASSKDSYGENVPVEVSYIHTAGGTHNATLVISEGTTELKRIPLTGTTNKVTPAIIWKENLSPMSRGENVTDPAEAIVELVYESSDSTVVDVEGNVLKPLKKGNATITAKYDGSESLVYNSNSSTINVLVTNLAVQHIHWTQPFTRLKWSDKPELSDKNTADFGLDATISYYDPETSQEVEITDRSVTYTSGNDSVVQVLEGNKLHVVGQGNTTLTAHIDGITDSLYEATVVRDVIVREPTLDCEKWVLENKSASMATEINSYTGVETVYNLSGEPGYLSFEAWREAIHIVVDWTGGNLFVAEKIGSDWHELTGTDGLALDLNYENRKAFDSIPLSREATQVKIYKKTGSTGIHAFSNAYVTLARYLELENTKGKKTHSIDLTATEAKPGVAVEKTFTVNYSNITDQLDVELMHGDKFSIVSGATIGNECGDKGTATVRVQFLSNDVDLYRDTLLVHNLTDTVYVYLSADVDKHHPQITWEPSTTNLKTTDNVTFNATTSASAAGLTISYAVTAGSDVATVDAATGALTIIKDGEVTIEARCEGNNKYYDAEPVPYTFHIEKVTPTITKAPKASDVTLPATLSASTWTENGEASVEGTFAWTNPSTALLAEDIAYEVTFTPKNTNWYTIATCMVTPLVSKATQTISWSFNATEMYGNADYTFDATASSGLEVAYSSSDNDIASVDDAHHLVLHKGGEVTITASQAGDGTYLPVSVSRTFTILRWKPSIVELPLGGTMYVGRVLSDASLTGGSAEVNGQTIQGSFNWENANTATINVPGPATHNVIFVPQNGNFYEEVNCGEVALTVLKYVPVITTNTLSATAIEFPSVLSNSNLSGSVTAWDYVHIPNVEVEGTVEWKNPDKVLRPRTAKDTAIFKPTNTNWYEVVEIAVPISVTGGFIFNGTTNTTWSDIENWNSTYLPAEDDPVLIKGDVDITTTITVGSLTIEPGADVVVKDGGILYVGQYDSEDRTAYGNLKVENGGKVIFNGGEVKVNDFILEAKLGDIDHPAVSGQVNGPEALNVTGEAYFDLVLDQRGACTPGWYDFSVPFPVDVMTGVVARYNMDGTLANDNLRNETEYAIMAHYEEIHATGQYAWKKFRGVMQPGVCYTMTINATSPIYRFKKAQGAEIVSHNALPLSFTDSEQGATTDKGWNAMGNGLLTFANLDVANTTKIQLYDHTTNSYSSHRADSVTFTVGSAFRIQAKAESLLDLNQALEARDILRAPGRRTAEVEEEELTIRLHANGRMEDQLFISASEEALDEYEIGHDLVKQGTMTDSKIGRIWCEAYNLKLCDVELPEQVGGTYFPLGFYSPKNATYTLSVDEPYEGQEIWLVQDGAPIWNLRESAYEITLNKGTNQSYAIRLVNAPRQTPTDIEETGEGVQVKGARKLMIDGKLFIIRDGQTFDGVGRKVK